MEDIILNKILDRLKDDKRSALVTLTNVEGSIPGKKGGLMGVFDDGTVIGTVGGGKVEHQVITLAKEAIVNGEHTGFSFDMTNENGLACGGTTSGFIKVFKPRNKLIIFGSGHVGRKIAWTAGKLEFDVYVVDDRPENRDLEDLKDIKEYIDTPLEESLKNISFDKNTYCVLALRSHFLDRQALKGVIDKDVAYIGMIGSKKKTIGVYKYLEEEGVDKALFDKVYAPVGIRVDDGTPEEIAFSVISQILMIKNNVDGRVLKM